MTPNSFIKLPGDHRQWNVYRKSVIICDVTEMFVRKYMTYSARTAEHGVKTTSATDSSLLTPNSSLLTARSAYL